MMGAIHPPSAPNEYQNHHRPRRHVREPMPPCFIASGLSRRMPPVIIDFADGTSVFIVRDIEMDRARKAVRADQVCCAADFEPEGGLSGDRDTALAQAAAECLRRAGETTVTVDRTLPYLYAHFILQAGIEIEYSENLGVDGAPDQGRRRDRAPAPRAEDHRRGDDLRLPDDRACQAGPRRDPAPRRRRAQLRTGPGHDHGLPGRAEFLQHPRLDRGDGSPCRRLPPFRRGTAEGGPAGDRRHLPDGQCHPLPWRHDADRRLRRAVGGTAPDACRRVRGKGRRVRRAQAGRDRRGGASGHGGGDRGAWLLDGPRRCAA